MRTRSLLFVGVALATMAPGPVRSSGHGADSQPSSRAAFEPNETLVSAQYDLLDPEYDQATSRLVWVDSSGNLWLASLDGEGMFQPPDGKGTLIDPDAMAVIDLRVTANGPEWIQTDQGAKVIYTKFRAGLPHTPRNARIALAEPVTPEASAWSVEILNTPGPRMAPYASKDPGDPTPRYKCVDPFRNHYSVELYNPESELRLPLIEQSSLGVRFVPDSEALVYAAPAPPDTIRQVFWYDHDTDVVEQLTFDPTQKPRASVWIWQAPEFNGDYVFLVLVTAGDSNVMDIYRGLGTPRVWTKVHTIQTPLGNIGSPEPFVFAGHSYISFQLTAGGDEWPASIWVAGIDPEENLVRRISDDTLFRWRTDPEVFITSDGPYVYYNRRDPADPNGCGKLCTEGVYRAHTGLTTPGSHGFKGPRHTQE
jgi:hypothetical protein